jgi:SPP1 gp7 family putative phage head morphogenesis protein
MIASTETTRIYAQANADAWESTEVVDEWEWMTAQDDLVCPVCGGLDGETFGIGDIDARPPAHVSCRCWERPVVSEAAFERKLEEIFR